MFARGRERWKETIPSQDSSGLHLAPKLVAAHVTDRVLPHDGVFCEDTTSGQVRFHEATALAPASGLDPLHPETSTAKA